MRSILKDVETYKTCGVNLIVCLLSDTELRSVGVQIKDYQKACDKCDIQLFKYPIIEMAPPTDIQAFHTDVIDVIINTLQSGKDVLVHCRGGVGRAGLLACCVLSRLCVFSNFRQTIEFVRKRRDKRCVESRK